MMDLGRLPRVDLTKSRGKLTIGSKMGRTVSARPQRFGSEDR